ncbi:hypothetical protein F0562_033529 [Nyssa sinensis]|uniref:Uncharacterized protein n=1 Tax=Nyssa sinensis TaxID=561372 RepID=A0A5J5ADF2_9ASTE|nr:hypothetical protein F0562_033529 [Nyssa sinensis]
MDPTVDILCLTWNCTFPTPSSRHTCDSVLIHLASVPLAFGNRRPRPPTVRFIDGLARAKASGAADADCAGGLCGCGFHNGLCFGIVSDVAAYICRRCCLDDSDHCSQLAFL